LAQFKSSLFVLRYLKSLFLFGTRVNTGQPCRLSSLARRIGAKRSVAKANLPGGG
jgi:hypothetical protein